MTDKERLESLKRNREWTEATGGKFYTVDSDDYKWLIEQAGRAKELEQQNKRYREALEFYAEESNYDYDVRVDSISYVGDQSEMKFYRLDSEILYDRGKKARQVLEGAE